MATLPYTHTGMAGLAARRSLTIDPILNQGRVWHACTHVIGATYRTLCGRTLVAVDPADSAWGARVAPAQAHQISCKRCQKQLRSHRRATT